MRKVRDYDAELKALNDRAKSLKAKRIEQLGQLVAATGADSLDAETLAGALLEAVGSKDASTREAWANKGQAFFQRAKRKAASTAQDDRSGAGSNSDGNAAG